MTTPLSPAAQAVLDAVAAALERGYSGPAAYDIAAAALRAAADQAVPEEPPLTQRQASNVVCVKRYQQRQQIRSELLSIANELDPTP
jgi:hypothetical protein